MATNPLAKVSAISLFVEDLAAAKTFYTTVFDVPIVAQDTVSCAVKFDNLIVNLLLAPEGEGLVAPAPVGGPDAGRRFQLSIWVDDLGSVVEQLEKHGIRALTGPVVQPWGMKTLTFADPAGHSWEVAQAVK
jgi:catechol 2,3-dioxygenase-like lactoylglutathione lyase family enzyme